LADTDGERASLLEQAGIMASVSASFDEAMGDLEEAETLFSSKGRTHDAARVSARIGGLSFLTSKLDDALVRMTSAFDILKNDEPDEDLAMLAAQLGRLHFFAGHLEEASDAIELALGVAESLWLPETISEAMNTKGLIASARGRPEESLALIRRSLEVALENDTPSAALRAYTNLANEMYERDRYDESTRLDLDAIALARRLGWSGPEWFARMQIVGHQSLSGAWDDVLSTMREALESDDPGVRAGLEGVALGAMEVASNRGDVDEVNRFFAIWDDYSASDDLQARAIYAVVRAVAANANGEQRQALVFAREAFDLRDALSHRHGAVKWSYPIAVSTALDVGDLGAAEELVSSVEAWKPGQISPLMRAMTERFRACLAPDEPETDARFKSATGLLREIGAPFHRACTMLDHARWLVANGRMGDAEPLLTEAREIFEELRAVPWLARLDAIAPSHVRN
jgi:tetratricopeptide (TPR) repeat protein